MTRAPIQCKKCRVYLSGKHRDDPRQLCNSCQGIGYSPKAQQGRKILFKKS